MLELKVAERIETEVKVKGVEEKIKSRMRRLGKGTKMSKQRDKKNKDE